MKYCNLCLTTDLRPNAMFKDGVCIACQYSKDTTGTFSKGKLQQFENVIKSALKKRRGNSDYDCIIGVSGGKDSTRQAHWVRDRLGLRPLLVCCGYPPKQMSDIGAKNLENLINMGFDVFLFTPAPGTSRDLVRQSFVKFGNVCKSTEMALFATVPRVAVDFDINTIFWGENPALQLGDAATEGANEFDGNNLRHANTLIDGGSSWMSSPAGKNWHLESYLYPTEIEFTRRKIQIYYLGPVWDDWGNFDNAQYAALNGLTLRTNEEAKTGDLSNASMLDEEFTNINMMIKYFKYGFGRATDQVNERIRNGEISRESGVQIVQEFDGVCDDAIIDQFCKYIDMDRAEFWQHIEHWLNNDLFDYRSGSRPVPKFEVGVGIYD